MASADLIILCRKLINQKDVFGNKKLIVLKIKAPENVSLRRN